MSAGSEIQIVISNQSYVESYVGNFQIEQRSDIEGVGHANMHWFEIILGTVFGLGGLVGLIAAFAGFVDRSFVTGFLTLSFGIAFVAWGLLHFAQGIGARWATPGLRSDLYFWFAVPCLAFWLLAWTVERRKKK